jgi:hypothetical protein
MALIEQRKFWHFVYSKVGDCSILKFKNVALYRRVGSLYSFRWVAL